jgi:hypothetical protein
MHWTAFLAYRRIPADARVADDLPCIGCGYNLRSALANGQCPECGRPVGDSLYVLARPDVVGGSLKTIACTYLAVFALLLMLSPGTAWPGIVAMGVLAVAAIVRCLAAMELRYRGAIQALPVIGDRLRMFYWLTVLDAAVSSAATVMLWVAARTGGVGGTIDKITNSLTVAALVTYGITSLAGGWMGSALSIMLNYFLSRWEFILHRIAGALALALGVVIVVTSGLSSLTTTLILVIMCVMLVIGSMLMLALGLLHLGGGAEHEHDTWDDVLDTEAD